MVNGADDVYVERKGRVKPERTAGPWHHGTTLRPGVLSEAPGGVLDADERIEGSAGVHPAALDHAGGPARECLSNAERRGRDQALVRTAGVYADLRRPPPPRGRHLPDHDEAAGGRRLPHPGRVKEVLPAERLAFTFIYEEPGPDDVETLVTLTLREPTTGSTELALEQSGFATEDRRELHRGDWFPAERERLADALDAAHREAAAQRPCTTGLSESLRLSAESRPSPARTVGGGERN
jgi:hypothetical protein